MNSFFLRTAEFTQGLRFNKFPDGQVQAKGPLDQDYYLRRPFQLCGLMRTAEDVLLCMGYIQMYRPEKLFISYLYGARSDKDTDGEQAVHNVADFMIDWLRALSDRMEIEILVPHNDFLQNSNLRVVYPEAKISTNDYDLIIYPDKSARKRMEPWLVGPTGHYVEAEKVRDQTTGQITSFHIHKDNLGSFKNILVLDDLCDGGRTFLQVADAIPPGPKLTLAIVHGVFSNGAVPKLLEKYETIIVTNSLPHEFTTNPDQRVCVVNVWPSGK